MIQFPEGFYFGSATSATQSEGCALEKGKRENIWDYWYAQSPEKFHNQVGPKDTSTFYKHFKEDIKLLKATGHNSCRISISWSRMFPLGFGEVNQEAVLFYQNVIDAFHEQNIEVMINLYHFDMPMALQNIGGWENRAVVDYYACYAKTCFELYGKQVKRWFTFNEPIVHVECGYLNGFHYPMRNDMKAAVQVAYHTALASALAIKYFHECPGTYKIGIILNLSPAYPKGDRDEDKRAARIAELFCNKSFLEPAVHGCYPQELMDILKEHDIFPIVDKQDFQILKENTVDFLGINYYQPVRVCAKKEGGSVEPLSPHSFYDVYDMPGKRINPYRGWEIYPEGMYDIACNIKEAYGNIEWMITENGMGVEGEDRFLVNGRIEDDYRIDFYKEHLTWLHKGIQEGSNCIGYHVWTGIDCWSWLNAYKNRYGLIALDLETEKRTIKKSGYWFKELETKGGF